MAQGDDYCNRQQINFTHQNADSDEARGVPAVGKTVYDSRNGRGPGLTVCYDTSPDANANGGGSWTGWFSYQPQLSAASGTQPNFGASSSSVGRYLLGNDGLCVVRLFCDFGGAGFSYGSSVDWRLSLPVAPDHLGASGDIAGGSLMMGGGWVYDANADMEYPIYVRNSGSNQWVNLQAVGTSAPVRGNFDSTTPFNWSGSPGSSFELVLHYQYIL